MTSEEDLLALFGMNYVLSSASLEGFLKIVLTEIGPSNREKLSMRLFSLCDEIALKSETAETEMFLKTFSIISA